jgi:hypothetical protein
LQNIAIELDAKGLSTRILKLFRQFYKSYPSIGQAVSAFLEMQKGQTSSALLENENLQIVSLKLIPISQTKTDQSEEAYAITVEKLLNNLSFSHFVELMKIEMIQKRMY